MPPFLDFDEDDDDAELELKFGSECVGCKHIRRPRVCNGCEVGENFEEDEPEGVDSMIRERSAW